MAKNRRTEADRKRERDDAERRAWELFQKKLEGIQTHIPANLFVKKGPRESDPGRRLYSNLAFFLDNFSVPDGSNYEELQLYLRLISRFRNDSSVNQAVLEKAESGVRIRMESFRPG